MNNKKMTDVASMQNKITSRWIRYYALLTNGKKIILAISILLIITAIYYCFIFTHYQQQIQKYQLAITQQKKDIKQYHLTQQQLPSIATLKMYHQDYVLPFSSHKSIDDRLQRFLINTKLIPENCEYDNHGIYKLTFTLTYSVLLELLDKSYQTGLFLTYLKVSPILPNLLSLQICFTELNPSLLVKSS